MQKTDIELNAEAQVIANETVAGANTKTRVAQILADLTDSKPNNSVITTIQGNVSTAQSTANTAVSNAAAAQSTADGAATSASNAASAASTAQTTANGAASAASAAQGDIDTHIADTANPHGVTKAQVGLGSVDNTSDEDKPVSLATQQAIDTVTKVLVTGTIALDDTAFGKMHVCSGTSADYTITLPTAIGNEGKMILFKGQNNVSNLNKLVTIDGSGTETINNSLTYAITTQGYLTIVARVTAGVGSWDVISFDQGLDYPWTPTWTGFSAGPTGTFKFKKGIGVVDIIITGASGTGVGADASITFTLPLSLTPSQTHRLLIPYLVNNNLGTTVAGCLIAASGNNVVSCYPTVAAGAWAGANSRYITGAWRIFTNE